MESTNTDNRPVQVKSAVTTGRRLFVEGDGRGAFGRRYRDLMIAFSNDLGGPDRLSEAQRSLIRRAATLAIEAERLEGQLSEGQEVSLETYTTAANALRRVLVTLYGPSLQRRARDITPADPLEYAKAISERTL